MMAVIFNEFTTQSRGGDGIHVVLMDSDYHLLLFLCLVIGEKGNNWFLGSRETTHTNMREQTVWCQRGKGGETKNVFSDDIACLLVCAHTYMWERFCACLRVFLHMLSLHVIIVRIQKEEGTPVINRKERNTTGTRLESNWLCDNAAVTAPWTGVDSGVFFGRAQVAGWVSMVCMAKGLLHRRTGMPARVYVHFLRWLGAWCALNRCPGRHCMQVCTFHRCFWHHRTYLRHNYCRVCICARVCAVCQCSFALGDESSGFQLF